MTCSHLICFVLAAFCTLSVSSAGRLSLQKGASLQVVAVRQEDEGWYQCRLLFLTQPHGDRNGSWIHLSVTTPPTFRSTPPTVLEMRQGERAQLVCEVGGIPEPEVSWRKDGAELSSGSPHSPVVWHQVRRCRAAPAGDRRPDDRPTRSCLYPLRSHALCRLFDNRRQCSSCVLLPGSSRSFAILNAQTHSPDPLHLSTRHLAAIQAVSSALLEAPTPGLYVSGGVLEIGPVDARNRGLYTCEASNIEGSINHSTTLLVIGPPIIVHPPQNTTINVTQDAVFECEAEAYPVNVTYAWSKHGINVHQLSQLFHRVLVQSNGSLRLTAPTPLDSGWYTCTASNGIGKSPRARAYLSVLHPAYSQAMPLTTVLVSGQGGRIQCPAVSNPPLSYVSWSKDGYPLKVTQLPGWSLDDEGAIVIDTVNSTALGNYSCTPYNSLGTMGSSTPTHIILKDPPKFVERPATSYQKEVGQELRIGCSASGDPQPRVGGGNVNYRVLEDGTLVLRMVSREHHGLWECIASTDVAMVTSNTQLQVTGTSPHPPTELMVSAGSFRVNVSWCPGFDGGYQQHFSVWFRQAAPQPHDWVYRKVPLGASWLWVEGLWPETCYQFSVLAQSVCGSSPFSEIVTAWTLHVPMATSPPWPPVTEGFHLLPPRSPTANQTQHGILLRWKPPLPPSLTPTTYLLESWTKSGWRLMESTIPATQEELLLSSLVKDTLYHMRLRSQCGPWISVPSQVVNVSTVGVVTLPPRDGPWASLDGPVRAGVIAGSCFLATAVTVSALVSCLSNWRKARRRQDIPIIFSGFQKSPETQSSNSPESVLKLKVPIPIYQTFPEVRCSPQSALVNRDSHAIHPLQGICRGADGRFVVEPEASRNMMLLWPGAQLPEIPWNLGLDREKGPGSPGQSHCHDFTLACSSPAGERSPLCILGLSPILSSPGTDSAPTAWGPGPQTPPPLWAGSGSHPRSVGPDFAPASSTSGAIQQSVVGETGAGSRELSPHGIVDHQERWSAGTRRRPSSITLSYSGQDTGVGSPWYLQHRQPLADPLPSPRSRCAALWAEFQEVRGAARSLWQGGVSQRPWTQATLL
ncbi:protein turtle homolog A-like [Hemitrygon akajei]|uniref:protein turtle homolog A-like n=1 Tax=Hemitrygon akajei TaxID=2704970 RepID=UPI003BF9AC86